MVDHVSGAPEERTAVASALLIEVMSPRTTSVDLGDKAAEVLHLPGLAPYLVFAEDEKKAWVWIRGAGGVPAGPGGVEGDTAAIPLPALGINVPLADVYSRLALD